MRRQQQIWLSEHTDRNVLPTMANVEPTSGVVLFTSYLNDNGTSFTGRAVDTGSGKGRNSVYLASLGYEVYALEYIQPAIDTATMLAKKSGVSRRVHFKLCEIDAPWAFDSDFFDIAVDSFSSIDIETKEGRKICCNEMYRTLKPGGYALVSVCSAKDEWEKELIAHYPGSEPNSTIWPQNGKFQKDYDEPELRELYKSFEIITIDEISKPAFKLGREGIATNFWVLLRKPLY